MTMGICKELRKDASKQSILAPRALLLSLKMWPENKTKVTRVYFWLAWTLCITLEAGQITYFVQNIKDITKLANTMSTISTTFQIIIKLPVLYINSAKLKGMITTIWYDFWPADLMGKKLEVSLKKTSQLILSSLLAILLTGTCFATGFLSSPLLKGVRELPFDSWYPFDWKRSPLYEIIYFLQSVLNVQTIIIGILGHDFLMLTMISNCVSQYRIMKKVVQKIGTEGSKDLNRKLQDFKCFGDECKRKLSKGDDEQLLIACVKQHLKLIRFQKNIQQVFSASMCVQLFSSVMSICVSTYLITKIDRSQIMPLVAYCVGHVFQLYLYCAAGSELSHQSYSLSEAIYASEWYSEKTIKTLKTGFQLMIQVSQRKFHLSAGGIAELDQNTFIKSLRLSFSFYTLLNEIN